MNVIERAELARAARAFNDTYRRAAIARRVDARRERERLEHHDSLLVHCDLCDTWLYTGERDSEGRRVPPRRRSLAAHDRAVHPDLITRAGTA